MVGILVVSVANHRIIKHLIVKQGNRLKYTTTSGEEMIEFRKAWTSDKLQVIMKDVSAQDGLSIDDIVETKEAIESVPTETIVEEKDGSTS